MVVRNPYQYVPNDTSGRKETFLLQNTYTFHCIPYRYTHLNRPTLLHTHSLV